MDAAAFTRYTDVLIDDVAVLFADPDSPDSLDGLTSSGAGDRSLGDLLASPRAVVDEAGVLEVLVTSVRLANVAAHLMATAAAACDRLGIPGRKRLKGSALMLTELGVAPAAAHRAARVGNAAHTLPAVTRAQRDGAMGIEQADAIGRGVAHVNSRVELADAERAEVATTLMVQITPAAITARAREIAIAMAPDEPEPGAPPIAEDYSLNEVEMRQNDEGRVSGSFDMDVLTGDALFSALDALCRPVPLPDGTPDPRTAARRRGDAFAELIRVYLSHSERPESGGVLPHVTLVRPAAGHPEVVGAVPQTDSGDRWGATVDRLGFTGPVSAATADLIACDASLTVVDVDGDGAPLDVGRAHRLFPPKLRKALIVRDRGCAFGGCGRPASWCDSHHMVSWADGGRTCVDNGVLLCRMHHMLIHHGGWEVFLGPDRHPWFRAPIDPEHPDRYREPIRSHARRTMTVLAHAG